MFLRYEPFFKELKLLNNKVEKNLVGIQKAVVDTQMNQFA